MSDSVEIELRDMWGQKHGTIRVTPLRSESAQRWTSTLVDLRAANRPENSTPPIQLLESCEYHFEVELLDCEGPVSTNKPECFDFDPTGLTGRLRPGLHTGTLAVDFEASGRDLGTLSFEVRSLKLNYRRHYRWMLSDLADAMAEVIMQRFAPTSQAFRPDSHRDPVTLYQRFAFLRSLLLDERIQGAFQQILQRPYLAWRKITESRRPGRGIRGMSELSRQLSKPGPRLKWRENDVVDSLPRRLNSRRSVSTLDNAENRFLKFALQRWRGVIAKIREALEGSSTSSPVERGLAECRELVDFIDSLLSRELFREVGRLEHFPASSQVLQKRAGYRDIFRAYAQFEVAAQLAWSGGQDVYSAGQRDVATLYEYWVFMKVAEIVSGLCDEPFDFGDLLEANDEGLNLRLERGRALALSGSVQRLGRRLCAEFYFNRTFSHTGAKSDSWTRRMRPDLSLRLYAEQETARLDEVWLHFDAKYRVSDVVELFADDNDGEEGAKPVEPKRSDLLKMHAYRDAIRRSAGAYVIYPGRRRSSREGLEFQEYHEVLPGLGAFALRPTGDSTPQGSATLERFIDRVLTHLSSRITEHERGRFWTRHAFGDTAEEDGSTRPAALVSHKPPADTLVLVGYVKNKAHLDWILSTGLYNLRADDRRGQVLPGSRILATDLVMLYGPALSTPRLYVIVGESRVVPKSRMLQLDYPSPGSSVYFCLAIGDEVSDRWPELAGWSSQDVSTVWDKLFSLEHEGAPAAATALELIQAGAELGL